MHCRSAILNSRFALDIVVEKFVGTDGTVFVVYFQGVLRDARGGAGVGMLAAQTNGTTVVVDSLMDGIQYFGVEQLDIDMGAGTDVVNVQGTTAITSIRTDAANPGIVPMNKVEAIYVSSDADLDHNLQGILLPAVQSNFDLLSGHLENILGRLDIDAGQGRNRIWISDEADTTGDTATITDGPVTPSAGGIVSEIKISGLSPAPIGFKANAQSNGTGGNFAGGVTIWTGRGGDTITIDGTHNRATATNPDGTPMRTVTTLNTGAGNDTVNVSLNTADGFFVLNTQAGDDTVDADGTATLAPTSLPIIVFGGFGSDTIYSGTGNDILFGDLGRVQYYDGSTLVARFGGGGPGDITDGVVRDPSLLFNAARRLRSAQRGNDGMQRDGETAAIRADDRIAGNSGHDIILGGGNDALAGHAPRTSPATRRRHRPRRLRPGHVGTDRCVHHGVIARVDTTDTQFGGEDRIEGGTEDDVLIGGSNGDQIDGDAGRDLIFGDNVSLSRIGRVGNFTDLRFQGLARLGHALHHGHGRRRARPEPRQGRQRQLHSASTRCGAPSWNDFAITLLDHDDAIQNTPLNRFGNDYIAGGAGDDKIFGQLGNDTIQGDGDIESAVARAITQLRRRNEPGTRVGACRTANPGGLGATDNQLLLNPSFESTTDGDDYIEGDGGNDVVFGDLGQDDIIGGSSSLFGLVTPQPAAGRRATCSSAAPASTSPATTPTPSTRPTAATRT